VSKKMDVASKKSKANT
jgi:sperm-associated antigen 16 protein